MPHKIGMILFVLLLSSCNIQEKLEKNSNENIAENTEEIKLTESGKFDELETMVNFNFSKKFIGNVSDDWVEYFHGDGESTPWSFRYDGGNMVLSQNSNNTFNTIILTPVDEKDGEISVDIKRISGEKDQGGGIIFRWIDENNYYVVRANPLEDNVVMYKMENGKRSDIKREGGNILSYGAEVSQLGDAWNNLKVVAEGNMFTIYLNDSEVMKVKDDTFQKSGRVGLWTKADARTYFDNFEVRS